ncbi:unnamed protein product [Microthlaspi erraticum]|uniref:Transcription repressor n=1 Tax=Microthlaspi erraticum TaxID=1685480 RepID=A0A6D2IC47_9BRAS|nr:unnamed protein product [Microthlaspi erraticum]
MPNQLQKSLHGYLSKIKRETGKLQLSSSKSLSTSKKWVINGYKHPKKLSFSFKHRRRTSKTRFNDDHVYQESGHAATLSDIDRFLEENFKSLCIRDGDDDDKDEEESDHLPTTKNKEKRESSDDSDESDDDDDDDDDDYRHRFERTWGPAVYDSPKPPDLRRREKLSPPPGSSTSRSNSSQTGGLVLPENCIAVLRHTEEPQEDFRRSMVEMMEARLRMQETEVDWDLMEELLFCYLNLNNKKSHKFILSAFVDLIIALRDKEKTITRKALVRSLSTRAARERLRKKMILADSFPHN